MNKKICQNIVNWDLISKFLLSKIQLCDRILILMFGLWSIDFVSSNPTLTSSPMGKYMSCMQWRKDPCGPLCYMQSKKDPCGTIVRHAKKERPTRDHCVACKERNTPWKHLSWAAFSDTMPFSRWSDSQECPGCGGTQDGMETRSQGRVAAGAGVGWTRSTMEVTEIRWRGTRR
jgi:hypothetical protein